MVLAAGLVGVPALAQQPGQKKLPSAEDACAALVAAAQDNDEKGMLDLFGPLGKSLVSTGNPAEDADRRARFVSRYREMHRLVQEPDGRTTLYIGAYNWPTPVPLASRDGAWYFDTAAGLKEILYRRVGRDETSAIRVCQELAAAQKEYCAAQGEYARSLASAEGQRDGLYWQAVEGEPSSPIGPLVAAAAWDRPKGSGGSPEPFRGYYFRVLARQGPRAPGGARSYLVHGRMTKGFAFVAFPAQYRVTGVMTFIVGPDGKVRERDLGPRTGTLAGGMKLFDPEPGWRVAALGEPAATHP
ncbi:MAG: DUF2950 family protein [Holophaga sp.]|jgi:hypothetical protein